MVVGSSFVDRNSTVAHSTLGVNSGTHYGSSRVVLGLSIVVECCSCQPFALPRRLALIARNLNWAYLMRAATGIRGRNRMRLSLFRRIRHS